MLGIAGRLALRHTERSRFLPTLADLNECVQLVLEQRGARRAESDGQRFLREMREAREVWERERAEDLAAKAGREQPMAVSANGSR